MQMTKGVFGGRKQVPLEDIFLSYISDLYNCSEYFHCKKYLNSLCHLALTIKMLFQLIISREKNHFHCHWNYMN